MYSNFQVCSTSSFLSPNEHSCLGFAGNPKKFNVAITRAEALLIVIGNRQLLSKVRMSVHRRLSKALYSDTFNLGFLLGRFYRVLRKARCLHWGLAKND